MDTTDRKESGPASPSGPSAWNDLPQPLRECGEIAVLRLSGILSEALTQTADLLFTEATEALTPHEREAFLEAAEFARQRQHGIVYDFMKHFETRFIRACQQRPNSLLGHVIDFDVKDLRIIEHHVLDDSLEPGKITEAIHNVCWRALQSITTQFRGMLGVRDLLPADIPLSPRIIEAATSDAIRDQPWRHRAKQRLAHALRWPLAARVNLLYRDLLDHLSARDLKSFALPDTPPAPAPAQQTHPPGALPAPTPAPQAPQARPDPTPMTPPESPARIAARDEVARFLNVTGLPGIVTDFLSQHWYPHLEAIHASQGPTSRAWQEAVRVMEELVWSLMAHPSREDCLQRTMRMPDLFRRLGEGMDARNLPVEVREGLLRFLTRRHAELLKLSLAQPETSLATVTVPAPTAAPAAADAPVTPPRLPAGQPAPVHDWVNSLKVGAWLAFHEPEGVVKELKLAWISPQRSLFLLTNRQGARALSLSAEALVRMTREGSLRALQTTQPERPTAKMRSNSGGA